MTAADFAALPLHDALLDQIAVEWPTRTCVLHLRAFLDAGAEAQPCEIRFSGVSNVHVPIQAPWGESVHVNSQRVEHDGFVLEMQSGDAIRILAATAAFTPVLSRPAA